MKSIPFLPTLLLAAKQSPKPIPNTLLASARAAMSRNDTDAAFQFLSEAFTENANMPGLYSCFEDLFRLKIQLYDDPGDRMGLASLLSDLSRYEEAAKELREILALSNGVLDSRVDKALEKKAASTLFRTEAAICAWDTLEEDSEALAELVRNDLASKRIPAVHPYEALMWPCLSLEDSSRIASMYSMRATGTFYDIDEVLPRKIAQERLEVAAHLRTPSKKRIKIGYISPDFTGRHPLAFLLQDFFRQHDTALFDIHLYSPYESDSSPEVEKIKQAVHHWTVLPSSAEEMTSTILEDNIDIMIDLCGYTGTSVIAEVMAHRVAPVQIAYMGFPASSGAKYIDFLVCDEVIVPPNDLSIRRHYSENLIYMPHCYFVNSHRYVLDAIENMPKTTRSEHGLPDVGFVFCCHSRPEKIDPATFRSWLKVLKEIREEGHDEGILEKANAVIWFLRSGDEMEENMRRFAQTEFELSNESLVFADKAPRDQHLNRLQLADLFLDTPAYNAHTVGIDCLSVGVPMVSLLRDSRSISSTDDIATDKLASRVGGSLLKSAGLHELVAPSMAEYEFIMKRCVVDCAWYSTVKERLLQNRKKSPLFDTERWMKNLESALIAIESNKQKTNYDVFVIDEQL
eukprot:scaffold24593_cov176-Cylindrotheca_fusiformis.AAC.1